MYYLEYLINWLVLLRTPIQFIDSLEYSYIQIFYGSITLVDKLGATHSILTATPLTKL